MHTLPQLKKAVGGTLRTLGTVVVVLVVVIPAAAWAGHQFADVPSSNVFHDDIDWMRDEGVTRGCNPPDNDEYCPEGNVTRQQMAAFMHRLETEGVFASADHEHAALFATATNASSTTNSNTDYEELRGASVSVEVPEGHEAVIVARFSAESACYGADGWCSVRLLVNGTEMQPAGGDHAFDSSDGSQDFSSWESHALERVSMTRPGGTHTVTVQVRTSDPSLNFRLEHWALVAEAKLTS